MATKEQYQLPRLDLTLLNQILRKLQVRLDEFDSEMPNETPEGGIILWNGDETTVPDGYARCDGTNGTPDLTASELTGTVYIMKKT